MKHHHPGCLNLSSPSPGNRPAKRTGKYWRKSDGHWIQRLYCFQCKKHFSKATQSPCVNQKKRHKNRSILRLLCGGVSQREAARILNVNRKTIVRKFLWLAEKEQQALIQHNRKMPKALEVEFDDLETFEHTKCKPLSVTLMVEYKTRRILGFEVSQMAAKGRLSAKAFKKYGRRKDHRTHGRRRLFVATKELVVPHAVIRSDSNPHYGDDVKKYFPHARHVTVLGGRSSSTGQGELKKLKFDPIFSLNHTCAMLRANINRLFRKTWCTTKKAERLKAHIAIYAMSHNRRLTTE